MNFNLNHSKYLAKLDKLFPPISWFQMLNFVDDLDDYELKVTETATADALVYEFQRGNDGRDWSSGSVLLQ